MIKSVVSKEIVRYGIAGGITTSINIIVYYIFVDLFRINYMISNSFAWTIAFTAAFLLNKKLVFMTKNNSVRETALEFWGFLCSRVLTGVAEILLLYLAVDICNLDDLIMKCIITLLAIIFNYILSKLFVFRNKDTDKGEKSI